MNNPFPVFDLAAFEAADAAGRRDLGAEVDRVCRSTGFLAIGRHGIPASVIDSAWTKAEAFFDLPSNDKRRVQAPYEGYPYGYLGPESEALAKSRGVDTPPDLKESFNGGPQSVPDGIKDQDALDFCYAATLWPENPPGFREAWIAYYRAMEDLAERIMKVFAVALELPEAYFDPFIDRPISALRALNYPERDQPPKPGQLRAGAHSDYGSLTILLPQAGSRGLEIQLASGEWMPVPPVDGAFVINIGDLMARWTNDRWVSTLHRVVSPAASEPRRMSFAFFHQPNWDAEIRCLESCLQPGETPKYGAVLSGPYLMSKFQSTTMPEVS